MDCVETEEHVAMTEQSGGTMPPPAHKPGDVVDGFVLTSDYEWVSISGSTQGAAPEAASDAVSESTADVSSKSTEVLATDDDQPKPKAQSIWIAVALWLVLSIAALVAVTFLPWSQAAIDGKVVHHTHFWGLSNLNVVAVVALIGFVVFGVVAASMANARHRVLAWVSLFLGFATLAWVPVQFAVRVNSLSNLAAKLLKQSGSHSKASITVTTGLWVWVGVAVVAAIAGAFVLRSISRRASNGAQG